MTVKKKLNLNFVRWNKTQLKSSSSIVLDVGKKSTWWVAFLPLNHNSPTFAGRNFAVALSFLVNGQYFKDYHKILGTLGLDHVSFTQWIYCWMDCTIRKKDRRLERAKSKNWSSSTWRKNPVRWLLSHSRPLQLRRYLPRCEDWHTLSTNVSCLSTLANNGLGTRPLKTDAAKKVLSSSRDNCNCWILKQFERTAYFLGIQAWVLRQNGKQKLCAKEWSKKHIFLSHFFIFYNKPKRMLKFLRNGFWIVIIQKIRKKGSSHSGKMHFSVSGHVTLGVVRWRHELDYSCPLWVLSKFGPIEAYMCRVIASWFFPSNGIKRYFNGPLKVAQ